MIRFCQQIRHVLGRVAGSMPRRHQHFAECESIAIFYFFGLEAVLSAAFTAGINPGRFQPRAELARTAHQIGMNMRLEDMRDGKARFARHIDINIDICSRIENRSDPFVIVTEKVGKLRDAFSLNGLKNERHDETLRQSDWELQQDQLALLPRKSTDLDRNRQKMIDHVGATIAVALRRLGSAP